MREMEHENGSGSPVLPRSSAEPRPLLPTLFKSLEVFLHHSEDRRASRGCSGEPASGLLHARTFTSCMSRLDLLPLVGSQ